MTRAHGAPHTASWRWYLCCSAELVRTWTCPIWVTRSEALEMPGSRRGEGRGDQVLSPVIAEDARVPHVALCLCRGGGCRWLLSPAVSWLGACGKELPWEAELSTAKGNPEARGKETGWGPLLALQEGEEQCCAPAAPHPRLMGRSPGDVAGGPKVYLETLQRWAGESWHFPP